VRLAILSAFGESFTRDNQGSKYRLVSHESRPSLTLIPAPGGEKRPMTYRFIEAVQRLTPNFTPAEWGKIYEKVGVRLHAGQLRKVFVVLSDDDRLRSGQRDSGPPLSGANALPSIRGGRGRGRGGRRGDGDRDSLKRGPDDAVGATPAKNRRGK